MNKSELINILLPTSGSNDIEELKLPNPKTKKTRKSLYAPIEEYIKLTDVEKRAIQEQKLHNFPKLFGTPNFYSDVESRHPALEMGETAKFYIALIEAAISSTSKEVMTVEDDPQKENTKRKKK